MPVPEITNRSNRLDAKTSTALFRLVVTFLLCVSASAAAASLWWPLSWDEGVFAWIGGIVARGGTPYVDAWDVKGPIAYFGYALANVLFGTNAYGVRILDLLLTLTGSFVVFRILVPLTNVRAATIGSLMLLVSVLAQGYNVNGQPDLWASWCLVFIVSLVTVPASLGRIFLASMFLGVAVLIKPVYAPLGMLIVLPVIYTCRTHWMSYTKYAGTIAVGIFVPIAVCVAWFWSRGAVDALFDGYIKFNVQSASANARTLDGVTAALIQYFQNRRAVVLSLPAIVIGLLGTFRWSDSVIPIWKTRLFTVWLVTLFALVILQNRWWAYHWTPTYPPLAIAACIGFYRLSTLQQIGRTGRLPQYGVAALVAIIAVGASLVPFRHISHVFRLVTHRITRDEYLRAFNDYPGVYTARDVANSAAYIAAHTEPDDYVLVWEDPNINVLSGRRTPSRFAFWTPLMPLTAAALTPLYERNRVEFFRAMGERPPALVLVERATWKDGLAHTMAYIPAKFPEFVDWIDQRYVESDTVGAFLVFKRR